MKELAQRIMQTINQQGYEAYLVGGCTRDTFLDKTPKDYDIATNAPNSFLEDNLGAINISGNLSLGVYNLGGIEIAQYRTESGYDGRRPSNVKLGVTLEEDAKRRDFTINSIYVDKDGKAVDLFGGLQDIESHVVRCIGDPEDRFSEDYLRMIRACRFASILGDDWSIETKTAYAIQRNAHKIVGISGERIVKELQKTSYYDGFAFLRLLAQLQMTGLLTYIFPEITRLAYLYQNEEHHPEGDAFKHSILCLGYLSKEYTDFKTLMSILFHDCGKASCYDSANLTFHGHAEEAEPIIRRVAERLKLPNEVRDCMIFCAVNHMKMHRVQEMRKGKVLNLLKSPYFDTLMKVCECDEKSRGHAFDKARFEANREYIEGLKSHIVDDGKGNRKVNLAINGHDILPYFEEGIKIGKVLRYLEQGVLDGTFDNERESLISRVSTLVWSDKIEEME